MRLSVNAALSEGGEESVDSEAKYRVKHASSCFSSAGLEGYELRGDLDLPPDKAPNTVSGALPSPFWLRSLKDSLLNPEMVRPDVEIGGGGGGVAFKIAGDGITVNGTFSLGVVVPGADRDL